MAWSVVLARLVRADHSHGSSDSSLATTPRQCFMKSIRSARPSPNQIPPEDGMKYGTGTPASLHMECSHECAAYFAKSYPSTCTKYSLLCAIRPAIWSSVPHTPKPACGGACISCSRHSRRSASCCLEYPSYAGVARRITHHPAGQPAPELQRVPCPCARC